MIGDASGLLLVIDRLGRTIAELEKQNAALTAQLQQLSSAAQQDPTSVSPRGPLCPASRGVLAMPGGFL